jgi:hypothetical protein
VSFLDNSLLLDLEKGSDFLDACKVTINNLNDLMECGKAVLAAGKPYKIGIVDTTTKLEDMVLPYAAKLYKETPMGKNWNGDNILTLPNGGGYLYLREAYTKMSNYIDTLFDRVIYLGHLKDKILEKAGKEVSAKDIDLTGKIRNIACANADAIGYMYRQGNKTIVSFKTSEEIICGARPDHLRDKEITLLEYNEGKFINHWNEIYID